MDTTLALPHLFTVNQDDPTLLTDSGRILFHALTARLLYISKCARPDLQLAIAFLCTRVQVSDTDDYNKLARVVKYLRVTLFITLILSMDENNTLRWYVDAVFLVHKDMRSHTGAFTTMGKEATNSGSNKKKSTPRALPRLNSLALMTKFYK